MKLARTSFAAVLTLAFAALRAEEFSPTIKPVPEKPAPPPALAPGVDLREVDKPRNTIIRLPSYVVKEDKEPKAPALKERDVLTTKAKIRIAYRDHPGLHFGNLPFFTNDGIAAAMAAEEERLEQKRESYDLVSLLPAGPDAKKAKAIVDQAFARTNFAPSR